MPLDKGNQLALYFFLSTDSGLRRALEGRTGAIGSAATVVNPPTSADDLYNRFANYVTKFNLQPADFPVNIKNLYVPGGGQNSVASSTRTILQALDGFYDPDSGPCPDGGDGGDEVASYAALAVIQ